MIKKINLRPPVHSDCTSGVSVFFQRAVPFWVLLGISLPALFGFFLHDYYTLKTAAYDNKLLRNRISRQADEISSQRRQIQSLAGQINGFKSKLTELNTFEQKIRIVANLDQADGSESLFGVGGPTPEDLDTTLDLSQKHNSLLREMHQQIQQLDLASTRQKNSLSSLYESLRQKRSLLASTPSIAPIEGWVSSRFGYRKSPFTERREFHKGLDIAARSGSPIVATAAGTVTFAGRKGLLGQVVVVDHGHGIVTRYGHAKKLLKKAGDQVKRGEIIAKVGNTGRSTGPHVHYEVLLNGVPVNPEKYIMK